VLGVWHTKRGAWECERRKILISGKPEASEM
jgi:hypothetical protein